MFVNQALKNILDFLGASTAVDLKYHLFMNDETITAATVLDDLDESDFTGYASIAAAEGAASIIAGPEAESLGPELTWTCTADLVTAQQAFGIYCTMKDAGGTRVLFAAFNFDAPVTIAFEDDVVKKKVNWYTKNFAP